MENVNESENENFTTSPDKSIFTCARIGKTKNGDKLYIRYYYCYDKFCAILEKERYENLNPNTSYEIQSLEDCNIDPLKDIGGYFLIGISVIDDIEYCFLENSTEKIDVLL